MNIIERFEDSRGRVFRMSDGREVVVDDYSISFSDGHPSGIDYYLGSNPGYGCATEAEAALLFSEQFPAVSEWTRIDLSLAADMLGLERIPLDVVVTASAVFILRYEGGTYVATYVNTNPCGCDGEVTFYHRQLDTRDRLVATRRFQDFCVNPLAQEAT